MTLYWGAYDDGEAKGEAVKMWVPMDECEQCGSRDIRLTPDDDPEVGYYNEVWTCVNGHNVEYWQVEPEPPGGEGCTDCPPVGYPTDKTRL
jgi:hypothetical protein